MRVVVSLLFIVTHLAIISLIQIVPLPQISVAFPSDPVMEQDEITAPSNTLASQEEYLSGTISSVQFDENRIPEWTPSGFWRSNLPSIQNANENPGRISFDAKIDMKRVDGTADHGHSITEFAGNKAYVDDSLTVLEGTSTVSMREGPVSDVETGIMIFNSSKVIIILDPNDVKLSSHFGGDGIDGALI